MIDDEGYEVVTIGGESTVKLKLQDFNVTQCPAYSTQNLHKGEGVALEIGAAGTQITAALGREDAGVGDHDAEDISLSQCPAYSVTASVSVTMNTEFALERCPAYATDSNKT